MVQHNSKPLSKYSSWIGRMTKSSRKNSFLVRIIVVTVRIYFVDQRIKVGIWSQGTL